MADFIISTLFDIVSCLCTGRAEANMGYLCDLQENKKFLITAMEELKDTRDAVKTRVYQAENNPNEPMKCNQEVNGWLQRVQTIEDEVVQVIQNADQEIDGRCFGGYCPQNCWTARNIGKLVSEKLRLVNDLKNKGNFVDVASKLPLPLVHIEPVDLTVGMESMLDKVLKLLAEDEVRIMGLYGSGGVGKTTLLKLINNAFDKSTTTTTTTTHGFDVVILVVVSKAVNIDAIQMEIGERLGLSSPVRTSIFNALSKKNFVLLLDDIWERVDLQSIGVPLGPEFNRKSKVIFTTRSETVCGLMDAHKKFRVECLSWDEAWALFQEKVGKEALNFHPKVPELAKIVAKECGGLPLALITIGRAMSTTKSLQEWNYAITTLRRAASDFQGMGDEVLPLLKLSYDYLHNETIKSCFLYCALYPEDHQIVKEKLIDYWIGEELILLNEFDHIHDARDYGYYVIGNLKSACLLESGGLYEETEVKMHDMIRDLALWIKRDKMLIIELFNGTSKKWHSAERIYLRPHPFHVTEVLSPPIEAPNLLTLVYGHSPYMLPPDSPSKLHEFLNLFQFMPLLRVLDLSFSKLDIFPIIITELLELRYLSLSATCIKVLPEELRKLVKLKHLDLSYLRDLEKSPSGVIGSLLDLQVLHLYRCPIADWDIIEAVYKLQHLNDLRITIFTQYTLNKLLRSSNQNLQMSIRVLYLEMSTTSGPSTTTSVVDGSIKSVEKLELLSNLEVLVLCDLPELINMHTAQQQQHLGSCFQNLSVITIVKCNALKDLTWVGYVCNLKKLTVESCMELEEIVKVFVDDDFGTTGGGGGGDEIISSKKKKMMNNNVQDVFKSLQTLSIFLLPKLKSICRNALVFHWLVSLYVNGCPKLKKLPFDSGSNVNNTLQKIKGEREWWSELQWEENHDNNYELLKSKFIPNRL